MPDMQQQFTTEIATLLTNAGCADSNLIRQATTNLKQYYAKPQCVPSLIQIASQHPEAHIRQMASVEVIKKINQHFIKLDDATRTDITKTVLQIILVEQNSRTRHSLARVISTIAKILIPISQWPELLPFLSQCCISENAGHREIGVYVLYTLFETLADTLQDAFEPMLDQLFDLFSKLIHDPDSYIVRITTLQALGKIAEFIDFQEPGIIKKFQDLVPNMVGVLEQALVKNDEDNAAKGFEVFDNLLYLDTAVLTKHIPQLLQFSITVSKNKNLEANMRILSLNFLCFLVEMKRSRIQKLGLVPSIIKELFPIGAEADDINDEDIDNDDLNDDEAFGRVAFRSLGSVAVSLPPQQVFPVVMELIQGNLSNPSEKYRSACMSTLTVIVDGCADFMRNKLDGLMPMIFQGLQDSSLIVKKAACAALCAFADELVAEVCLFHSTLLPLLFQLINNTTSRTILTYSTNALDVILDGMEEADLLPYLPALMEKLMFLLMQPEGTAEFKATVIGAIGSAAHSSGKNFIPYFPQVIACLIQYGKLKDSDKDILLRGVAIDTMSAVGKAVGKETLQPYMNEIMTLAMESLSIKNAARLQECTFCFFGVISQVLEADFEGYLPHVVPVMIASCEQVEKDFNDLQDEKDFADEGDLDEHEDRVRIHSSIAEEKESAADALGTIFAATRQHYLPYVETTLNAFMTLLSNYHEGVRKAAQGALILSLHTFYKMSNPKEKWTAGLPLAPNSQVHQNVLEMIDLVMTGILKMLEEEFDKIAVVNVLGDLADTLKLIGPAVIAKPEYKEGVYKLAMSIFRKEHICQEELLDDDETDMENPDTSTSSAGFVDEDQTEHDALLISSASDLVCALSIAIGPQFVDDYAHFHPFVLKYLKPTRTDGERSMAMGTIAEISLGLKEGVTKHTEEFMKIFFQGLADESEEVKSNAAYGVGVLVLNSQMDLTPHYMSILQQLQGLFSSTAPLINVKDNACGAVSRMILKSPKSVPLDVVVPVIMKLLPLTKDYLENNVVFKALLNVVVQQENGISSGLVKLDDLLRVFAGVLGDPKEQLDDETRELVVSFLNHIREQMGNEMNNIVSGFPAEKQQVIAKFFK